MEKRSTETKPIKHETTVERKSERELVVTRTFNGPAHVVFSAWTKPELLKRWWVPKSCGASFLSCEADVRTGGTYRFVFSHPSSEQPMSFFGRYVEVTPPSRLACHYFVQQLPQSPLPEVSDGGTRSLDRRASKGASPDALRPCRLHAPCAISALGVTEQEVHLWPVAPGQRRNTSRDRL